MLITLLILGVHIESQIEIGTPTLNEGGGIANCWSRYLLHIRIVKKGQQKKQLIMFCIVQIMLDAVEQVNGMFLITADHGNGEDMVKRNLTTGAPILDKEGKVQVLTSHTCNPVRQLYTLSLFTIKLRTLIIGPLCA